MAEEKHPETAASGPGQTPPSPLPPGSGWGAFALRWMKRLAILAVVLIVVSVIGIVVADRRTSKPEFCGSCHIMTSYYDSWHADVHGRKLEIACIECHYAPGERDTVLAKLRGLSQVASYVSGRYGASRPRAHVDNLSCLTSKCHGDYAFLDKPLPLGTLGTVKFVHAKHFQLDENKHLHFPRDRQEAKQKEMEDLTQTLRQLVGPDRFAKLEEAANEAVPAQVQMERMKKLVGEADLHVDPAAGKIFADATLAGSRCAAGQPAVHQLPLLRGRGEGPVAWPDRRPVPERRSPCRQALFGKNFLVLHLPFQQREFQHG